MEDSPQWQFGDRVEIGGRTMLRPGFSLVGLTGVVFPTAPNAPAGCYTVAVNWVAHGYSEESGYPDGSLPLFVNVPGPHLSPAPDEEPAPPEAKKPAKFQPKNQFPELRRDKGESAPGEPEETPKTPKRDDEPEGRPRLRLV